MVLLTTATKGQQVRLSLPEVPLHLHLHQATMGLLHLTMRALLHQRLHTTKAHDHQSMNITARHLITAVAPGLAVAAGAAAKVLAEGRWAALSISVP